jgi:hypothetical protein
MTRARWALALATMLVSTEASAQAIFHVENGKLPTSPLSSDVKYFGGRVISNVKIVEISWNASVDSTYMTQLQGFYTAIVKSPFIDWMTEYDTIGLTSFTDLQPGTNQHIGRGSFVSSVVLNPTNKATTLSDDDIQKELLAQLASNALPAPSLDAGGNVDSLYMIDFPPGVTITLVGLQSCSSFGAYHGTVTYQNNSVPYGVHPYCGYSFDTSTLIHSHELAEAMTDMEVGLVEYNTTNLCARPLAWTTLAQTAWASAETADLCEGTSAKVANYTVQKVWSNYAQGCVAQIPICDGVLIPPACRPCNSFDSGQACTDACALGGKKQGQCVTCTSKYKVACTGATPACDDATYTCVECAANADCTNAGKPICETSTHTCRGCTTDADCGGGDAGVDAGASLACDVPSGKCVACNTDAQCKTNETCTAHACVPKIVEAGTDAGDDESGSGGGGCSCDTSPSKSSLDWLFFIATAFLMHRVMQYWTRVRSRVRR